MVRSILLSAALVLAALMMIGGLAPLSLAQAQQTDAKPAAKPAPKPAAAGPLKSQKDKVSYSIGMDIGKNFKNQGIEVDPALLARGMRDVLSGGKVLLTEDEVREVMTEFQTAMREQHTKKQTVIADKNLKDGAAFLAANKSKPGVKTTTTGLEYKVVTEGTGKMPTLEDTVTAHYRGTLLDGTEFDSSYKRGQPASFPVSGVIPGWTEVLQLMKAGAKYQVWIPANLGYGERGAGNVIGPNAMLTFEIELIEVTK